MMKKFSPLALGLALTATTANAALQDTFTTNINYVGSSTYASKIDSAETKIRNVIHSDEFKSRVLNFTYNGVKRFVDNKGLTNAQIYDKILKAAETALPTSDNQMDLKVYTYYQNSTTVGHTGSGISIYFNTKYLKGYSTSETAKTLTHEWLHKLGFHHAVSYSTSRDYSVPYGVGRIMKELAAKY